MAYNVNIFVTERSCIAHSQHLYGWIWSVSVTSLLY